MKLLDAWRPLRRGWPLPAYNSDTKTHTPCRQKSSVTAALWTAFCESALLGNLQENSPSVKIKMLTLFTAAKIHRWGFMSIIVKLFLRTLLWHEPNNSETVLNFQNQSVEYTMEAHGSPAPKHMKTTDKKMSLKCSLGAFQVYRRRCSVIWLKAVTLMPCFQLQYALQPPWQEPCSC